MRTIRFTWVLISLLSLGLHAQQKVDKTKQSIEVNKDVVIDLNTNYVEVQVDTWNKNTVEVEAYIESSQLGAQELKEAVANWNLEINGSMDAVTINSSGARAVTVRGYKEGDYAVYLRELEQQLADMPPIPEMPEMPEIPEIPEMPEFPELPDLPEGVKRIEFDYEAYKRDGEKYLEEWSKKYEEKYGKQFQKEMEVWAKRFAESDYQKRMEEWADRYAEKFEGKWSKDMEKWGEEFGAQFGEEWAKEMEKWGEKFGEDFGKQMENWGERFGRQMEREAREIERMAARAEREAARAARHQSLEEAEKLRQKSAKSRVIRGYRSHGSESKIKKVIKIKIPKKARLKVNVRHGELTFASVIHDLNGSVAYAPFTATEIDGGRTSINVSYAPVVVQNWKIGELNLNYVEDAVVDSAEQLILNASSSNVQLGKLLGSAVIDGSFGDLEILNIADSFSNLNILVENSEARIALPQTNYNLQFKGSRSRLSHPEKQEGNTSAFSTGDLSSGKTIVVNAKFSSVTMQ